MRKICFSANTACSVEVNGTALALSVPKSFSITMRERSTRPASPSIRTAESGMSSRLAAKIANRGR